jgi:hypothetical protein
MMKSLHDRGYNVMAISSPSWKEFVHMVNLAAPILLTMISKVWKLYQGKDIVFRFIIEYSSLKGFWPILGNK